jgi:peptidoglycan/LPS O-acetylase OafA/YrhL
MRIRALDFFRGIAISGVAFHHFAAMPLSEFVQSNYPAYAAFLTPVINSGWLGVTIFFVTSGVVLYNTKIIDTGASILAYYRHRALRLLPLYALVIFATFLINNDTAQTMASQLFWLLSGLHDLRPSLWEPNALWVCWSLGVEILFSILLPAIIWLTNRRKMIEIVGIVILFCFLYRIVADQLWFSWYPDYLNSLINPLKDNIIGCIDNFIIGMAAGRMIRRKRHIKNEFVLPALIVFVLSIYGWGLVIGSHRSFLISVLASTLHITVSTSVAVVLVAASRSALFNRAWTSPLVFMGTICYSAYLFHAFIFKYVPGFNTTAYWASHHSLFGAIAVSVAGLALTIIVSMISFIYIESIGIKHIPPWAATLQHRIGLGAKAAMEWRLPQNRRCKDQSVA